MNYNWPGNVRELFNVLVRSLIFLSGDKLTAPGIYITTRTAVRITEATDTENQTLDEVIRNHIVRVLTATENKKTKAAQTLGIQRRQLYRLIDTYNLPHTKSIRVSDA